MPMKIVFKNANARAWRFTRGGVGTFARGVVVCQVELGLGPSLPPAALARRDSALFEKMDAYFLLRRRQSRWRRGASDATPDAGLVSVRR